MANGFGKQGAKNLAQNTKAQPKAKRLKELVRATLSTLHPKYSFIVGVGYVEPQLQLVISYCWAKSVDASLIQVWNQSCTARIAHLNSLTKVGLYWVDIPSGFTTDSQRPGAFYRLAKQIKEQYGGGWVNYAYQDYPDIAWGGITHELDSVPIKDLLAQDEDWIFKTNLKGKTSGHITLPQIIY